MYPDADPMHFPRDGDYSTINIPTECLLSGGLDRYWHASRRLSASSHGGGCRAMMLIASGVVFTAQAFDRIARPKF